MTSPHISDFEEKVHLATQVPGPSQAFEEHLWRSIASQPARGPLPAKPGRFTWHIFPRPLWIAAAAMLVIAIIISSVGPQRVLASFRSLFGFIPGVGFVENTETVRFIDGAVQAEREGITVTVESGAIDAQGFHLSMKVEGMPRDKSLYTASSRGTTENPYLQLPSGETLQLLSGASGAGDSIQAQYLFQSVPDGVDSVLLVLPSLPGLEPGKAPDDWQIPLKLRAASGSDRITASTPLQLRSERHGGTTLILEEVAQDAEKTMLQVRLDTGDAWISLNGEWWTRLRLTDRDGKIYPLTDTPTADPMNTLVRVLRTVPFIHAERLTLSLDQTDMTIAVRIDDQPGFRFDPGRDAQVGQTWRLDKTLQVQGYSLHFTRAELAQEERGSALRFDVDPQPGLTTLLLGCGNADDCSGGTAGRWNGSGPMQTDLAFKKIPNRVVQVRVASLMTSVQGPWQIDWQTQPLPAEIQARPSSTPAPTATIPAPTPTAPVQDTLAGEVRDLLQKGFTALYGQAGWVHIVSEKIEPENSGYIGPAHSINEIWQYVEADGTIHKNVWLGMTLDGAIWQKIARVGKTQVNFTTGTAIDDPRLETKAHPEPLPEAILNHGKGAKAIREEVVLDGRSCLLINRHTAFDQPMEITSIPQRVKWTEHQTWIDRETGQIVKIEIIYGLEDGADYILQTMRYLTSERVDAPPPEIQYLLDQVTTP
ncbi:MAG: DUF4179 domain-containing protein [Anaerolineaceae bacterium]|nr:DUF4179 domain-containing protein [Anaerolineaceae bacterium]